MVCGLPPTWGHELHFFPSKLDFLLEEGTSKKLALYSQPDGVGNEMDGIKTKYMRQRNKKLRAI